MSGTQITNNQVKIYMKSRKEGYTQKISAAKAGISVRSGHDIEHGKRQDPKTKDRHWRTRKDPLEPVWDSELVPLLEESPTLLGSTLLDYLQNNYTDKYPDSILRTLQRRVREWKGKYGKDKEVMFRQIHEPGALGLSDFTTLKGITVTIRGKVFKYILYHFRLAFSGWSNLKITIGGESYTALTEGLQDSLRRLGGCPSEHRTDSLSAAFKNISKEAIDDITKKYHDFCEHYSMKPTRNNLGCKHENGSIESAHGHVKRRIKQAFLLRGSYDFDSVEEYQIWLDEVVNNHNRRNAKNIDIERASLQVLPETKATDYDEVIAKVSSSSTIQVRCSLYTVPSRLVGHNLRIKLYSNRLECYLGSSYLFNLERVYSQGTKRRAKLINYKHVIHSLVRKPQAFRGSQLRDDLLPNEQYKQIWQYADLNMPAHTACKFIVGILYIAANEDCESELGWAVVDAIANKKVLKLTDFQSKFQSKKIEHPEIEVNQHSLVQYEQLIPQTQEVANYV